MKKIAIILFLISMQLMADDSIEFLKKYLDKISKYQSVQCEFDYFYIGDNGFQIESKYFSVFQINSKDTGLGGYYYFKDLDTSEPYISIYNGEEYFDFNPSYYADSVIKAINRSEHNEKFQREEVEFEGMKGYIPADFENFGFNNVFFFNINAYLRLFIDSQKYSSLIVKDTIIENVNCLLFKFEYYNLAFDKINRNLILAEFNTPYGNSNAKFYNYKFNEANPKLYFTNKAFPVNSKFSAEPKIKERESLNIGSIAPNWILKNLENKDIDFRATLSKPALLIFTENGCPACMLAIPKLNEIWEQYKDKINLFALYSRDNEKTVSNLVALKKIKYASFPKADKAAKDYKISGFPTFYLVDKNSKIIAIKNGYSDILKDEIIKEIEKIIAE